MGSTRLERDRIDLFPMKHVFRVGHPQLPKAESLKVLLEGAGDFSVGNIAFLTRPDNPRGGTNPLESLPSLDSPDCLP